MSNKLDLELFETLDNEIDKTLNFWLMFIWHHTEWFEFLSHTINRWLVTIDWDVYNLKWKKEDRFVVDKIFWHYPTTNEVLRYCRIKWKDNISFWIYPKEIVIKIKNTKIWKMLYLDITKPIQQQTDEQKQKLIDFLNNIT